MMAGEDMSLAGGEGGPLGLGRRTLCCVQSSSPPPHFLKGFGLYLGQFDGMSI